MKSINRPTVPNRATAKTITLRLSSTLRKARMPSKNWIQAPSLTLAPQPGGAAGHSTSWMSDRSGNARGTTSDAHLRTAAASRETNMTVADPAGFTLRQCGDARSNASARSASLCGRASSAPMAAR
jgi:hypothetical protein